MPPLPMRRAGRRRRHRSFVIRGPQRMRQPPPVPDNEDYRQAVVDAYRLREIDDDPILRQVVHLASRRFGVPIALISIVEGDVQWFLSRTGLDAHETPRDHAFCARTILGADVLVVPDAAADDRFADNPLVTGPPGIRFYAGAPLVADAGVRLGSLCLIDTTPHADFPREDAADLEALAALVMERLARRRSGVDQGGTVEATVETAADAARQRVLDVVGHELRTPLNAIVGFAELIGLQTSADARADNRIAEYAGHIETSGRRLISVVERILDYAALKGGELPIRPEPTVLGAILDEVVGVARASASLRSVDIALVRSPELAQTVLIDRPQAATIIDALIGNAVEATPPGGRVEVAAALADTGPLRLWVRDGGGGLSLADRERIPLAFERDRDPRRSADGGTGLGLAMTRALAVAHGGRLVLADAPDGGTEARFELPRWRIVEPTEARRVGDSAAG